MADNAFWNRMAKRYIAGPVPDVAIYREKLARTQAGFTPDTEVLEIGSGSGATALAHAPFVKHIDAFDFSSVMVTHAQGAAKAAGVTNVTFEVASLESLAEAKTYDVVLALSLIHLLRDRAGGLAKITRLLKPGGLLISSTTCLGPASILRPLIAIPSALGLLPKVAFITADQLKAEMTQAGLIIREHWQPKPRAAHFIIAQKPGDEAKVAAPMA